LSILSISYYYSSSSVHFIASWTTRSLAGIASYATRRTLLRDYFYYSRGNNRTTRLVWDISLPINHLYLSTILPSYSTSIGRHHRSDILVKGKIGIYPLITPSTPGCYRLARRRTKGLVRISLREQTTSIHQTPLPLDYGLDLWVYGTETLSAILERRGTSLKVVLVSGHRVHTLRQQYLAT
jgi:hypothetical protein